MRELHASAFAAATCVDLRLHHNDRRLEPLRAFAGFIFGKGNFTAGGGDAIARKDRLGLILVNLHRVIVPCDPKTGQPVLEFWHLQNTEVYFGTLRRSKVAPKCRENPPSWCATAQVSS